MDMVTAFLGEGVKVLDVITPSCSLEETQPLLKDVVVLKKECKHTITLRSRIVCIHLNAYITKFASNVKLNGINFGNALRKLGLIFGSERRHRSDDDSRAQHNELLMVVRALFIGIQIELLILKLHIRCFEESTDGPLEESSLAADHLGLYGDSESIQDIELACFVLNRLRIIMLLPLLL